MSALSPAAPVDSDVAAAVAFRDRILAAFLADLGTLLIRRDDAVARVRLTSGAEIVLITCPANASPSALRATFEAVVEAAPAGIVHLVAVGGDRSVALELKRSRPFWQLKTQFGVHHVALDGKVKRVAGKPLRTLKQLVADAPTDALPEDYIASLLAQGHKMSTDDARLDTALRVRFPWVTLAIAASCIALFLLGEHWADGNNLLALYRMGANSGADVKAGEPWRVLASAFLHANVGHIVVNMIALASFGLMLERLLGSRRYIVLYGLSALGGGLASALLRGPGLAVGASGAIWGLMAAGVALAIRPRGLLPELRLAQARRRAAGPLAINIMYSFAPGIDLFAHFGGGAVGFALMMTGIITRGVSPAWTTGSDVPQQQRPSSGWTLAAVVVSIAMVGSVVVALVVGRPWEIGKPPALTSVQVADTGVTLELPSSIAGPPLEKIEGNYRVFTFGDPTNERVGVELVVTVLGQVVAPEQLEEVLQVEQKALQAALLPGAQRDGDATIVTVGGRRFATAAHHINQVSLRSWVSVFGDREIVLRVYSIPDRPTSWAGIEEKIVASLQVR
jgi:rhomboid protease GluP